MIKEFFEGVWQLFIETLIGAVALLIVTAIAIFIWFMYATAPVL